jgi:hypothetical protein
MTAVFVDFEASSLGPHSYPIEVAWVDESGAGESYLIRPAATWTDWDPVAEGIHGISRTQLIAHGVDVVVVAHRAAAVLLRPGTRLYASSQTHDGFWLERLLEAGEIDDRVRVSSHMSAYDLACKPLLRLLPPRDAPDRGWHLQRVRNIAIEIVERAEEVEHLRQAGITAHRALPDAMSLWRTWKAVGDAVGEWLAKDAT